MSVDKRLTNEEKKKIKPVNQGGGPNYLGKQETVTVPKKWLSDPDHVVAELAYITPREQKILLDANIYGSLKGKPNKGPGGIMSLQGDLGGYDASPGGPNSGGGSGDQDRNKQRAADIMTGRVNVSSPTGVTEGYKGPEGVRDSFGNYVGGKYTGNQGFLGNLFSGANKYGYRDVYTSGPKQGEMKPGYAGRILGGLASLATGIPFVGGAIGSAIDYGKGIFGKGPKDMSGYNSLGLGGTGQEGFGVPTTQGDYDVLGNKIDEITGEITAPSGASLGFLEGYPGQKKGIETVVPVTGGSDDYTKLVQQYLPVSTMPEDEELLGGFKSRFLQNRTPDERKAIEKMINEKFKYNYADY